MGVVNAVQKAYVRSDQAMARPHLYGIPEPPEDIHYGLWGWILSFLAFLLVFLSGDLTVMFVSFSVVFLGFILNEQIKEQYRFRCNQYDRAVARMADRVGLLIGRALAAPFPRLVPLAGGSSEARIRGRRVQENHILSLLAIRDYEDPLVDALVERIAGYTVPDEVLRLTDQRAEYILHLAEERKRSAAVYLIYPFYDGNPVAIDIVQQALRIAAKASENPAPITAWPR